MTTSDERLDIPRDEELALRLTAMAVPFDAMTALLSLASRLDDRQRAHLEWSAATIRDATDTVRGMAELPDLTEPHAGAGANAGAGAGRNTPFGRLGYVLMYASLLPEIQARHAERGIDPLVSQHTLADLGRNMAVYQKRYGVVGFDEQRWLSLHFSGQLFQLGRLQFQRIGVGTRTAGAAQASGSDVTAGEPALSLHIPRWLGPLSPRAIDTSIAAATSLFRDRFPDAPVRVAVCASWLLDPQLGELLPASNIATFARRFRTVRPPEPDDTSALRFTFENPDLPLAALPRHTSLERAVIDVLLRGGQWHTGYGWFPW